jgi:hypothetical protein
MIKYSVFRHFAVAVIQNEKKRVLAEWREEKARQQLQRHKVVGEAGGCEEGHAPGAINSPGGGHNGNADDDHYYDEVRLAAKRAQVEEWRRQKAEEKKQKEARRCITMIPWDILIINNAYMFDS